MTRVASQNLYLWFKELKRYDTVAYYWSIKLTYYEVYNFERTYINKNAFNFNWNLHLVSHMQLQAEAEINKHSAFRGTARHNKTVLPTTQHDRQR